MKKFVSLIAKTHITFKIAITNIFMLMPFFFVSIFLFHPTLIEKINAPLLSDLYFWFLLCLCFCLSLLSFYVNLVLSIICFIYYLFCWLCVSVCLVWCSLNSLSGLSKTPNSIPSQK